MAETKLSALSRMTSLGPPPPKSEAVANSSVATQAEPADGPSLDASFGKLPLYFIENGGQLDRRGGQCLAACVPR